MKDQGLNYLANVLAAARRRDATLSVRELARRLGYRNPSYVADLVAGRRRLQPKMAGRIASVLALSPRDAMALETYAASGKTRSEPAKQRLALDQFRYIADWFHVVILEMVRMPSFRYAPEDIARRLRRKISPAAAQLALERLLRLRLIKREGSGAKATPASLHIGDDQASDAIRSHHTQMLALARDALIELPLSDRDMRGTILPIRKADWPRLLAVVARFHQELHDLAADEHAELVVTVNTQTFHLTTSEDAK